MKYLLYLSSVERQLWGKDGNGWQRVAGETRDPVWVVTDLAEESFAEIKTPRLFGRDRSSYLDRKIASRYPDTTYRVCMTPPQGGDLMEKLVPTRHILFGIDSAERIDSELDAISMPVTGVWPVSMLLAQLGQDRQLPANLFIVLPGPGTLRIVYLKNRTPVLTRLTLTPNRVDAQVDEIIRTLRHLENTQIVRRDRQTHPVLLLGDRDGFEAPMEKVSLNLVDLPHREKAPLIDWRFPLFDLAVKSPAGQVAPLVRRSEFLALRLSKAARVLTAATVLAGIVAISNNLWSAFGILNDNQLIEESVQQFNVKISEVDSSIAKFGVDPELVRRAVDLANSEINTAPEMEKDLHLIADVLSVDQNLRLKDFQWRLLAPGLAPCSVEVDTDQAAANAGNAQPETETRKVELSIELAVPDTYGPRDQAQVLQSISSALNRIKGLKLWKDANKDIAGGSLRGGSVSREAAQLTWCMTLPGDSIHADVSADTAKK